MSLDEFSKALVGYGPRDGGPNVPEERVAPLLSETVGRTEGGTIGYQQFLSVMTRWGEAYQRREPGWGW